MTLWVHGLLRILRPIFFVVLLLKANILNVALFHVIHKFYISTIIVKDNKKF